MRLSTYKSEGASPTVLIDRLRRIAQIDGFVFHQRLNHKFGLRVIRSKVILVFRLAVAWLPALTTFAALADVYA